MSFLFPAVFLFNNLAMTGLLIVLSLLGKPILAADVGIVQAATLALLYAFSANARSLILNKASPVSARSIMAVRLALILPLSLAAYWLSVSVAGVDGLVAGALILRRGAEWLNEVHLSEMEREHQRSLVSRYLFIQIVLLAFLIGWIFSGQPAYIGFLVWALIPLLLSARFMLESLGAFSLDFRKMPSAILPHFGSTAITGITVYVFRLSLILIVGRALSGDFFSAFAIGGVTGSIFANALGSSIALHEQRTGLRYFPAFMKNILYAILLLGLGIASCSFLYPSLLAWTQKSSLFWMAVGISMMGGVLMVYAQRIRFSLLQHDIEHDVFGPDVLMNIFVVASIPFFYYMGGVTLLVSLYLWSAALAYLFYGSTKGRFNYFGDQRSARQFKFALGVLLLLPVFFQLNGGLFRDPSLNFESGGVLGRLPIPISVLACYGGLLLLGLYRRASFALTVIFFTFLGMVGVSIATSNGHFHAERAKFMLLIQFILPMIGLVLGQMYENNQKEGNEQDHAVMEKSFLWVLAATVPAQLIAGWMQGHMDLIPGLYIFSIYQHAQYVPVIFVSAFLISYFSLWRHSGYKWILLVMLPLIGIYACASQSILLVSFYLAALLVFSIYRLKKFGDVERLKHLGVVLLSISMYSLVLNAHHLPVFGTESQHAMLNAWEYYAAHIFQNVQTLLFGHLTPPDRIEYPSAYNYHLDLIYNFGLISWAPVAVAVTYTGYFIVNKWKYICASPGMFGAAIVLFFLVIVESSADAALRQPYPGIFVFFLWGVFLTRLATVDRQEPCLGIDKQ